MAQPPYGGPPEGPYGSGGPGGPYGPPPPHGGPSGPQDPYGQQQGPYGYPQDPYGQQQGPYGHPQDPYGQQQGPYGHPQDPYGQQQGHPGTGPQHPYEHAAHAPGPEGPYGPNPYLGPEQEKRGKGCVIAAIVAVVLVIILVAGILVLVALSDDSPREDPGAAVEPQEEIEEEEPVEEEPAEEEPAGEGTAEHAALPECSAFEGGMLAEHVPDPDLTTDDTDSGETWEWRDCQWNTGSLGFGEVPGFTAVRIFLSEDTASRTGNEESRGEMARDQERFGAESVSGIGEDAIAWFDAEDELGCLGAVTSNLYVQTCYDQQADGQDWGTIDQGEAMGIAEEMAVEFIGLLEAQEY